MRAIEKAGVLLVFPIKNAPEPRSLWHAFHPKSQMRWDWSESGDPRVASLWHLKTALGEGDDVVYGKWFQGRATFFSKPVYAALLRLVGSPEVQSRELSLEAAQLLALLLEEELAADAAPPPARALELEGRLDDIRLQPGAEGALDPPSGRRQGRGRRGVLPGARHRRDQAPLGRRLEGAGHLGQDAAEARWREAVPAGVGLRPAPGAAAQSCFSTKSQFTRSHHDLMNRARRCGSRCNRRAPTRRS